MACRPLHRLLQGRVRSDRHRLPVDLKVREHDRWNEGIVLDEPGIEGVDPVDPAEEHHAFLVLEIGPLVELAALQAVRPVVVFEGQRFRVEACKSFVGAQPQMAVGVLQDAVDVVVGEPILLPVGDEGPARRHVLVQPAGGADPQRVVLALVNVKNDVAAQGGRVAGVLHEAPEASRLRDP